MTGAARRLPLVQRDDLCFVPGVDLPYFRLVARRSVRSGVSPQL